MEHNIFKTLKNRLSCFINYRTKGYDLSCINSHCV